MALIEDSSPLFPSLYYELQTSSCLEFVDLSSESLGPSIILDHESLSFNYFDKATLLVPTSCINSMNTNDIA